MGYYVNPRGETKEAFLNRVGTRVERPVYGNVPPDHMLVVLVNNGWMTAAGIAYSEREFEAFTGADDPRPKTFYHVPISALQSLDDSQINEMLARAA